MMDPLIVRTKHLPVSASRKPKQILQCSFCKCQGHICSSCAYRASTPRDVEIPFRGDDDMESVQQ